MPLIFKRIALLSPTGSFHRSKGFVLVPQRIRFGLRKDCFGQPKGILWETLTGAVSFKCAHPQHIDFLLCEVAPIPSAQVLLRKAGELHSV